MSFYYVVPNTISRKKEDSLLCLFLYRSCSESSCRSFCVWPWGSSRNCSAQMTTTTHWRRRMDTSVSKNHNHRKNRQSKKDNFRSADCLYHHAVLLMFLLSGLDWNGSSSLLRVGSLSMLFSNYSRSVWSYGSPVYSLMSFFGMFVP